MVVEKGKKEVHLDVEFIPKENHSSGEIVIQGLGIGS